MNTPQSDTMKAIDRTFVHQTCENLHIPTPTEVYIYEAPDGSNFVQKKMVVFTQRPTVAVPKLKQDQ